MTTDTPHYTFKVDQYSYARGGYSELVRVSCAACDTFVMDYQKDGPGYLYRGYIDRVLGPDELVKTYEAVISIDNCPMLQCPSCNAVLAKPMVFALESRVALKFKRNAVVKRKADGTQYEPTEYVEPPADVVAECPSAYTDDF